MRNLNYLVTLLISLSGFYLFTLYSCVAGEPEQIGHYPDNKEAVALCARPEVTVAVVNEIVGAEVTVQKLILKNETYQVDTVEIREEEGSIIQKIDYNIILGATKTCFPPFVLGQNIPEDCSLEILVSFASLPGGTLEKREETFRYELKDALGIQWIPAPNQHIGIIMVLVETEEDDFDADWMVANL